MANYSLEIIQPQAGLDTKNVFYKAYTGTKYNVRCAVFGGDYPYEYSLTTSPTGMTIDIKTGEIAWDNPVEAGSPHDVTVSVKDLGSGGGGNGAGGTTVTADFTVTVSTTDWLFIDAVNGTTTAGGGDGTIGNPFKEIKDWYEGDLVADRLKNTYKDNFVYYYTGTYTLNGHILGDNEMQMRGGVKPQVHMAFPGETPTIAFGPAPLTRFEFVDGALGDNICKNIYFSGFIFDPITETHAIHVNGTGGNFGCWKCTFKNLPSNAAESNESGVFLARGNELTTGAASERFAIQDCTFDGIDGGFAVLAYACKRIVAEDNTLLRFDDPLNEGSSHGFGWKHEIQYVAERHNTWTLEGGQGPQGITWIGFVEQGADEGITDIEVCYNYYRGTDRLIRCPQTADDGVGPVFFYRNTFVGGELNVRTSADTPVYDFTNNVMAMSTGGADKIECSGSFCATQLTTTDNLLGLDDGSIVDSNGLLVDRTKVGTRGWELGMDVGGTGGGVQFGRL